MRQNFKFDLQRFAELTLTQDGDMYLIGSKTDLQTLADFVNDGGDTSGKTFKLTADITVDFHIGTSDNKFKGTFDGGGHTITVNYNDGGALFNYVQGAKIQNLTVNGTINTSTKYAAGIVSQTGDTTTIDNCTSSVTIDSTVAGDGTHGGFVGVVEGGGTLNISNSTFDGKLLGSSTDRCGGFVGYNGSSLNINNSVFAPTRITIGTNESKTFARSDNDHTPNLSGNYYTQIFGNEQDGTKLSTLTLPEGVTTETQPDFTSKDGVNYYATGTKITLNGLGEGYFRGSDGKFVVDNTYTMPAMNTTLEAVTPPTISATVGNETVTLNLSTSTSKATPATKFLQ